MTRAATVSPPEPVPDDEPAAPSAAGPGADRSAHPGRLRRARDFDALRRTSHRARRGPVRVAWVPADGAGARVAYAVGRRVGGAVVRNRLRRRLRAIVAGLDLRAGDYLVAVGPEAADLPFPELQAAVTAAVDALR